MNHPPAKPPIAAARWARIRLFAMDVDGVLTDGTVLVSSDGTESKAFSVLDGLGLARLRDHGVILAWTFLGERMQLFHVAGLALILAGVTLVARKPANQDATRQ